MKAQLQIKRVEDWRPVVGFSEMYAVSSMGNLKNILTNKKVVGGVNKTGYRNVLLYKNGVRKNFKVHRLVAISFLDNPDNKETVNHKNGLKDDNRLENLEWCTVKENNIHAFNTGLKKAARGEKGGHTKLKNEQVLEIRKLKPTMTTYELAKVYGVSFQLISLICLKKIWKHI